MIRNPFKTRDRRRMFDAMVQCFQDGELRNPNGTQNRGGSHKVSFWNGYNGVQDHYTNPESIGWAAYRAGQACRKAETGDPVPRSPQHRFHPLPK